MATAAVAYSAEPFNVIDGQIDSRTPTASSLYPEISSHYLDVSFYPGREHQLDLQKVDTPNRLFALALTVLQPVDKHYAVTSYENTFNWPAVFERLRELSAAEGYSWSRQEFYVVEFRSRLKEHIDRELLFKLDKESHREATAAGGLLKYWYGSPDEHRRNLATCLWRGKADALLGGQGMWHKQARGIIGEMYEVIDVKGLKLVVEEHAKEWSFAPFLFH